jgi:hypothetical protein
VKWASGSVIGSITVPELARAPQQLAVRVGDPQHTANVAVLAGDGFRRITAESDDRVARIDLGTVRVVKWTSKEGIALEGIATFRRDTRKGGAIRFSSCRTADRNRTISSCSIPACARNREVGGGQSHAGSAQSWAVREFVHRRILREHGYLVCDRNLVGRAVSRVSTN